MPLIKFYKQAASKLNKSQVTSLQILYTTRNTPIPETATTWSKVATEKLNFGQVVEKLPKLYSIRSYIAGSHLPQPPHYYSHGPSQHYLTFFSVFETGFFSSGSPTKLFMSFSFCNKCHMLQSPHPFQSCTIRVNYVLPLKYTSSTPSAATR